MANLEREEQARKEKLAQEERENQKMAEDLIAKEAAEAKKEADEAAAAAVAAAAGGGGGASANGPMSPARISAQLAQQEALLVRDGRWCEHLCLDCACFSQLEKYSRMYVYCGMSAKEFFVKPLTCPVLTMSVVRRFFRLFHCTPS